MRYHITPDGPKKCTAASPATCKYSAEDHFDSRAVADAEYERRVGASVMSGGLTMLSKSGITTGSLPLTARDTPMLELATEQERVRNAAVREGRSITGMEMDRRKVYVERAMQYEVDHNRDTQSRYSRDTPNGRVYDPDRARQHAEIVTAFLDRAKNVDRGHKVIFSGGLGGSGKSTVLAEMGLDKSRWITLNNDDIKEEMARRGMIPRVKGLTPMEACPLVHEEASDVLSDLTAAATSRGMNVIFDGTMSSTKSMIGKIDRFRRSGYSVGAVFVDVSVDTSIRRAESRYERGMSQYTTSHGHGIGGRWLPKDVVLKNRGEKLKSRNAETLVSLARDGVFDEDPVVWDNDVDGRSPRRIDWPEFSGAVTEDLEGPSLDISM